MKKNKAIILGAGPAGLVTAWQLLKKNWDVEVYEKANIVGGMCRTWKWNNFHVDTGPHIFHTPDKNLESFWEKHFGDLLIKGKFWCKNIKGEQFNEKWTYPLSWESIAKFPKKIKNQILKEIKNIDPEDKARAKSFEDYMLGQIGPTLTNIFFHKYPEKIWGIKTNQMSANWAPKRIEIRNTNTPFYHGQYSAVGKQGTGSVYERIASHIKKLKGKLILNHTVTGIETKGNTISNLIFNNKKKVKVSRNTTVISTLPITITARFLGYKSNLKFRGIKSVFLIYNRERIIQDKDQWLYYDSEKILFNRVTENKKLSKFVGPKNKSLLTAEITFSKGDKIDKYDKKKLINEVKNQIEIVGLANKKDFFDASINSEYFVYPVQDVGFSEELSIIKNNINKYEKFYSIGTGGDFNYADSQVLFHKAFDLVDVLTDKESSSSQVIKIANAPNPESTVYLNKKAVGENNKPYIIAEIGLNHNNSVKLAKETIDLAVKCGCDAVKFQTYKKDSRVSKAVKSEKYVEKILGLEESISEMFNRLVLTESDHKEIFNYARKKGIEVFSTPFDVESLNFLEKMNVNFYKIASVDLVNLPLIKKVAETNKPVILSCGMSNIGQVEEAVQTVYSTGNRKLILLHCNSSYPSDPEDMNLRVIETLKKNFGVPVGLSDHTFGIFVSQLAITLGANIIERHFTKDRMMEGPDHILSSDYSEMKKLVKSSFQIPKILGNGIKKIQPNEYLTLNMQRKCLYANTDIKKGQIITDEMMSIKGPGGGLLPKYKDMIVGRKAKVDIKKDHPIMWKLI